MNEIYKVNWLMNKAVKQIGFEVLTKYFKYVVDDLHCLNCVSIGSGNGVTEYMLKDIFPDINLICVDPKPQSFIRYPKDGKFIVPKYSHINELTQNNAEIIQNCIILLIWSDPECLYDIEAITTLQPKAIIAIYENNEIAGSSSFHIWRKENANYVEKFMTQKNINERFAGRAFEMQYRISLFMTSRKN